jgi:hypothetical protein
MDTSIFGTRPVIGRIRGTRLTARKRIWYRNSFQTYLSAELTDHENQTLVRCGFSMHPFVIAFVAVWFAGAVFGGGTLFIQSLIRLISDPSRAPGSVWGGLAVPVGLILFGAGLLAFGRWLACDEQAFLIDFVRTAGASAVDTIHPPVSDHTAD